LPKKRKQALPIQPRHDSGHGGEKNIPARKKQLRPMKKQLRPDPSACWKGGRKGKKKRQ